MLSVTASLVSTEAYGPSTGPNTLLTMPNLFCLASYTVSPISGGLEHLTMILPSLVISVTFPKKSMLIPSLPG